MLVDTDVLIWHLRGYGQATQRLDKLDGLTLPAVSYLEILQGVRNKAEWVAVKKMLARRGAIILPLTKGHHAAGDPVDGIPYLEPWFANGRCADCRDRA